MDSEVERIAALPRSEGLQGAGVAAAPGLNRECLSHAALLRSSRRGWERAGVRGEALPAQTSVLSPNTGRPGGC